MKDEIAGITRANEGIQGITWNILGQTYVPKHRTEHSFSWHATFPPGTFVPPHIHPDQDEYLYILEGRLDFMLNGADEFATPGDLVRLPATNPLFLGDAMVQQLLIAPKRVFAIKRQGPGLLQLCFADRHIFGPWHLLQLL